MARPLLYIHIVNMRILITTQIVDKNDPDLGFFHSWLIKFSERFESIEVICLFKDEFDLPGNITVHSLGKEKKKESKLVNTWRFYKILWNLRGRYDAVFVHMNPEYVILGGLFWRLTGKKVLLWYTHKAVNLRLRLAALLATKIFTASKESFRLPSKKVEVVGHGIDVEKFESNHSNPPRNFLFAVGRISPSKDWETVIKGLVDLNTVNTGVPSPLLDIAGAPITKADFEYLRKLQSLYGNIAFQTFTPDEMPHQYAAHYLLIHTSRTGSMDKVVLEALAAGRIVVTSSEAYANLAEGELKGVVFRFSPGDYQELARTIEKIYKAGIVVPNQQAIEYVRKNHNLDTLIGKIVAYFSV